MKSGMMSHRAGCSGDPQNFALVESSAILFQFFLWKILDCKESFTHSVRRCRPILEPPNESKRLLSTERKIRTLSSRKACKNNTLSHFFHLQTNSVRVI